MSTLPEDSDGSLSARAFIRAKELIEICRESKSEKLYLAHLPQLEQLPDLHDLPSLKDLNISGTSVTGLAPIASLRSLTRLYLAGARVTDLSPVRSLQNLRVIDASNLKISDLTPLSDLHNLEVLDLSAIEVDSPQSEGNSIISRVGNAFTSLGFGTPFIDLEPIGNLTNLRILNISNTLLSDISPLSGLKNLEVLRLSNTEVLDIGPLSTLYNLEQLSLDRTRVSDLSPLSAASKIKELQISFSQITDLMPIANMELIAYSVGNRHRGIDFTGCPISDPALRRLSETANPQRSLDTLNYVRGKAGLPLINPLPEAPNQGPGPHFIIRGDGRIGQAPPRGLDEAGNNRERLRNLHPFLQKAARDLCDSISPNQHPSLRDIAGEYREIVEHELDEISFDALYGVGLRLENSAAVSDRQIDDRLLPPLEDPAREALDSVLGLHAPFILSTKAGVDLTELANSYRPQSDTNVIRDAAIELGSRLEREPKIITADSASLVLQSAQALGQGAQTNRTASFALTVITNLAIVLATAAVVGVAIVGGSGLIVAAAGAIGGAFLYAAKDILKKSATYEEFTASGGRNLDAFVENFQKIGSTARELGFERYVKFVIENEDLLRKIAGERPQFRWLNRQLDWIKLNYKGNPT